LITLADIGGLAISDTRGAKPAPPELWDGKTAARIADVLERYLAAGAPLRQG
jgi:hypothetical protein